MCRLSSLSLTAAVMLATLAAVPPARAGAGSDWRACNGRDVDDRIAACTRIIDQAGAKNPTMRTGAFNNRGIAYFSKGEFDRAIRDFDDVMRTNKDLYVKMFHALLKDGVYLPPSAFEVSFLSVAHTDAVVGRALGLWKQVVKQLA